MFLLLHPVRGHNVASDTNLERAHSDLINCPGSFNANEARRCRRCHRSGNGPKSQPALDSSAISVSSPSPSKSNDSKVVPPLSSTQATRRPTLPFTASDTPPVLHPASTRRRLMGIPVGESCSERDRQQCRSWSVNICHLLGPSSTTPRHSALNLHG